jgi:folate-binding protein YgfZ
VYKRQLKKLGMYKINLDVVIEDMADLRVYYSNVRMRDVAIYKDPRYSKLGYRIISDSDPHAQSSYMSDKYKYAIPDGGVDLLYDKAMPQEYGAEELHAISYTKGCYVGQEVISRTKSQGVVRKKIYKISADINLSEINHGAILVAGDQKIGIFCSGYKNYGIALIREENLKEKFGIAIALNGIEVHIECAEWYHAAS